MRKEIYELLQNKPVFIIIPAILAFIIIILIILLIPGIIYKECEECEVVEVTAPALGEKSEEDSSLPQALGEGGEEEDAAAAQALAEEGGVAAQGTLTSEVINNCEECEKCNNCEINKINVNGVCEPLEKYYKKCNKDELFINGKCVLFSEEIIPFLEKGVIGIDELILKDRNSKGRCEFIPITYK